MIAYLKGKIISKDIDRFIIEAGAIGYEVIAGPAVLQAVALNSTSEIYTYLHVREDAQLLYGFLSLQDRKLFQKLLSVSGIGPKSALSIINTMELNRLLLAVQTEDHTAFDDVPGIGTKTAKKIIIELKTKFDDWPLEDLAARPGQKPDLRLDLLQALEQLGYTAPQIQPILRELDLSALTLDQALKLVLQNLGKK